MSEKLVVPVPVFAALLVIIIFATAVAAYVMPIEVGVRWQSVFWAYSLRSA